MSGVDRIRHHGLAAATPRAVSRGERPAAATLRAVVLAPRTAVWTADCTMAVELARVAGPDGGGIETPSHLLRHGPAVARWDLDQPETKIWLYELCLSYGGCFDIYGCVNLGELTRLWPRLRLPSGVRAQWTAALREVGALPRTAGPAHVECVPERTASSDNLGSGVNGDAAVRA